MSQYLLSLKNVHKSYNDKIALKGVSLQIKQGSIHGLIGQNGAGKTSMIRIINKIIEADSGEILLNDVTITQKEVSKIGYMPEERGLYKNMTLEEQVLYFGQLKGMTKDAAFKQLDYWLEKFELTSYKKKKIHQLSKGMAQKVQFIVTVLHQPSLLILDEPFSGFDPVNANLIASEIKNLAKQGTTIIFSSHRMESVEVMCDEISLIHQGTILLQGTIANIKEQYAIKAYQIVIENPKEELLTLFVEKYNASITKHASTVTLNVSNSTLENNSFLQEVMEIGLVKSFQQNIPTLQDIFIKTIQDA